MSKTKVAIIGSGNIGTDLMTKVLRTAQHVEKGAIAGIDPESDGLARAARLGVVTTHHGVEGLTKLPVFDDIEIIFEPRPLRRTSRTRSGCNRSASG